MGEGLKIDVCIVGGGMITNDLILPSVYHLQRIGVAGKISICALNNGPLRDLKNNAEIKEAFPGQDFEAYPSLDNPADKKFPDAAVAHLDPVFECLVFPVAPERKIITRW